MEDEVMRIVDNLPIGLNSKQIGDVSVDKELEDQNKKIEYLKGKLKKKTSRGGSQQELASLQKKLDAEFEKLDRLLQIKLEKHSKSMEPTNIIHLPTTEDEDNLPPIMLYAEDNSNQSVLHQPTVQRVNRLSAKRVIDPVQRVPSHDHPVPSQQQQAEQKFQKIQKKLLDLCCNDIQNRSAKKRSNKDAQNNLNDDVKKQFDSLYSELRVLEKELFHNVNPSVFDRLENSEDKTDDIQTLKQRNAMLREQGQHFQVLFKEQQLEIENYRKKYMDTLQNVMEQHMRINSIENMSKCSEKKRYEEIVRMKNNLRKKLDHLAPMSNLLENCNNKLIHTIKRKTELEQNYEDICDELRQLKKVLANSTDVTYKARCESLGAELKRMKESNDFNNKRINQLQQQLQQARCELERVKVKSSNTIKSTTKKCDFLRSELTTRVNQLEMELANLRAITAANSK